MRCSCWCGGNADACATADRHTSPDAAVADAIEGRSTGWTFGRCTGCSSDRSIATQSRMCEPCASSQRRAYFASDAARAAVDAVMGRTITVAPVVELHPSARRSISEAA